MKSNLVIVSIAPLSPYSISTGSSEPIYRQLVDQIRRLIIAGQWQPGDSLPSVRDTANHLAINPMTVSKAYTLLESEGLIERRRGIGMTVRAAPRSAQSLDARLALLQPILERAAMEAQELEIKPEHALNLFRQLLKARQSQIQKALSRYLMNQKNFRYRYKTPP
jgi:GntR family transcriptional regulator